MAEYVAENLRRRFGDALERISDERGDLAVWVDRTRVHELLEHCKGDPELDFCFCMDVTAIDYLPLGGSPRFAVVYHLYSLRTGNRLRVKAGVPENDPVMPTAVDVWKSTDWFEREVYDMFGIRFEGHPNMKRILCHKDFQGHALRKDYPADLRWKLASPDDLLDEISSDEMQRIRSRVSRPISE